MRSTFSTSAPNQASIWVQAGPAWTPVKSMTLIPVSGRLVMMDSILVDIVWCSLLPNACRVEVGQMAAFCAVAWVDHAVDKSRAARHQRAGEGDGELVGCGRLISLAPERLDQAVVAGWWHQGRRRRIRRRGVDTVAAVDAAVVEDDGDHRQPVAADRLQLHPAEPECAVAFDSDHGRAALHRGGDRITHPDSHPPPDAGVAASAYRSRCARSQVRWRPR